MGTSQEMTKQSMIESVQLEAEMQRSLPPAPGLWGADTEAWGASAGAGVTARSLALISEQFPPTPVTHSHSTRDGDTLTAQENGGGDPLPSLQERAGSLLRGSWGRPGRLFPALRRVV